jgi:hypothetical protein
LPEKRDGPTACKPVRRREEGEGKEKQSVRQDLTSFIFFRLNISHCSRMRNELAGELGDMGAAPHCIIRQHQFACNLSPGVLPNRKMLLAFLSPQSNICQVFRLVYTGVEIGSIGGAKKLKSTARKNIQQ